MAAITDRTELDPNTEMEELLAKAAAVVEILMHDTTLPARPRARRREGGT